MLAKINLYRSDDPNEHSNYFKYIKYNGKECKILDYKWTYSQAIEKEIYVLVECDGKIFPLMLKDIIVCS